MLEIEIRVCEALAARGLVPIEATKVMRKKASVDVARVAEIEAEVHHDVIAFVTAAAESIGPEGRFLHFGMTSSDVLDTTFALQLVEASDALEKALIKLIAAVRKQVNAHRGTVMAGRTHGIHAEPITFGLKLAGWYTELLRALDRLRAARVEISHGALSGAVGTYAMNGPDIEAEVLESLGLIVEPVSTQVVPRDRHAMFFATLATIGGGLERFATEIRHMQRTELLEALEPFGKGQKGSSAMPHKRNPVLTENLTGLARMVRSMALPAMEDVALWHERDISHSSVERMIGPDATVTLDFALARLTGVVDKLLVYPENMEKNLNKFRGLVHSQRVLLALTQAGLSREDAYRLVQRNAMKVWEHGADFLEELLADKDVAAALSEAEIREKFDLGYHTKHVDTIFKRVFGEA